MCLTSVPLKITGRLSQMMLSSVELTRLVSRYRKLSDQFKRQLRERFGDTFSMQPIRRGGGAR